MALRPPDRDERSGADAYQDKGKSHPVSGSVRKMLRPGWCPWGDILSGFDVLLFIVKD
jgi:hypothetical protein